MNILLFCRNEIFAYRVKGGALCGCLRVESSVGSIVADEHGYGGGGDNDIAQPAESIGDLSEYEEAKDRRKNDLAIIVDGNFPRGGEGIGGGDSELTAGCRQTCQKQDAKLFHRHGMILEKKVGQRADAGKGREKEHNEGPFYAAGA